MVMRDLRYVVALAWVCSVGLMGGVSNAAAQGAARVLAVSEPPAPVLPSDPPTGLIFSLPHDLSAAAPTFDAAGITDEPVRLEYLRFDAAGNGYLTFHDGSDAPATGGVLVIDAFATRSGVARAGGTFDAGSDRLLSGAEADLAGPRDLAVADELGVVIVADFAEADLKVFDLAFRGSAAPCSSLLTSASPPPVSPERRGDSPSTASKTVSSSAQPTVPCWFTTTICSTTGKADPTA